MREIFSFILTHVGIAVPVLVVIIIFIKDHYNRNKNEKEKLLDQIEQLRAIIHENNVKAEERLNEYERNRISRDIKLALGYTKDDLIDIIIKYCPDKLMAAKNQYEIKREIDEAKDDYNWDKFIKEQYLPIIGADRFFIYHYKLQTSKLIIRSHKKLTPQEVIEQIDFYLENHSRNFNDIELLSCISPLNIHLESYDDVFCNFLCEEEVRDIAKLIAEQFDIDISENSIENILHPDDHSSYRRSISGIDKIFAKVLFYSEEIYSQLSFLDEEVFVNAIFDYFFCEICYNIKDFRVFMPEIINDVKKYRTFFSDTTLKDTTKNILED